MWPSDAIAARIDRFALIVMKQTKGNHGNLFCTDTILGTV